MQNTLDGSLSYLGSSIKLSALCVLLIFPALRFQALGSPTIHAAWSRGALFLGFFSWLALPVVYLFPALKYAPFALFLLILVLSCLALPMKWNRQLVLEFLRLSAVYLCAANFVFAVAFLYGGMDHPLATTAHRWFHWAADNELQWDVAKSVWAQSSAQPALALHLHQRPPLQSSLVLLFAPFVVTDLDYQLLGIALQCLALVAIFCLLRSCGERLNTSIATVALTALSGFFFMNAAYAWPRLLSAAFLIWAAMEIEARPQKSLVIGALCALAFLSHGGAMFGIIGILVWACLRGRRPAIVPLVASCFGALLPWFLWQAYLGQPSDGLLKWHLAGVVKGSEEGTLPTIWQSYCSLSLEQLLSFKFQNIKIQFLEPLAVDRFFELGLANGFKSWWDFQFLILFFACFPSLILLMFSPIYGATIKRQTTNKIHGIWIATLGATCTLMFGPALDVPATSANALPSLPHQTYLSALILLSLGLLAIQRLPSGARAIGITTHCACSTLPYFFPPVNPPGMEFVDVPYYTPLIFALFSLGYLLLVALAPEAVTGRNIQAHEPSG